MKYLTAICYTTKKEPGTQGQFLKYHNIADTDKEKSKFINKMKGKFPSLEYVNWYCKTTGEKRGQTKVI